MSSSTDPRAANYRPPTVNPTSNYQLGGWYNGQQWDGSKLGPKGVTIVGNNAQNNAPAQQQQQSPSSPQFADINRQVEDYGAIIDRDYNTALSGLETQEGDLKSQAATASGAISSGAAPVKSAIADAQATNIAGLEAQQSQVQTQAKGAVQQARDLYRETQQQNIAQLSASGLSSSSVAEALAEKLGVETARRIAGVTNSSNEVLQNLAQERTRVDTYFKNKTTEVETNLQNQLAGVQQALMTGINQINQAKQLAAADKANRRQELLSRAQSAVAQLQTQAQQFAQSLQVWNQQKQDALAQANSFAAITPDRSAFDNSTQNVSSILGPNFQTQLSVNAKGQPTYLYKSAPKKKDDDEDEELF